MNEKELATLQTEHDEALMHTMAVAKRLSAINKEIEAPKSKASPLVRIASLLVEVIAIQNMILLQERKATIFSTEKPLIVASRN